MGLKFIQDSITEVKTIELNTLFDNKKEFAFLFGNFNEESTKKLTSMCSKLIEWTKSIYKIIFYMFIILWSCLSLSFIFFIISSIVALFIKDWIIGTILFGFGIFFILLSFLFFGFWYYYKLKLTDNYTIDNLYKYLKGISGNINYNNLYLLPYALNYYFCIIKKDKLSASYDNEFTDTYEFKEDNDNAIFEKNKTKKRMRKLWFSTPKQIVVLLLQSAEFILRCLNECEHNAHKDSNEDDEDKTKNDEIVFNDTSYTNNEKIKQETASTIKTDSKIITSQKPKPINLDLEDQWDWTELDEESNTKKNSLNEYDDSLNDFFVENNEILKSKNSNNSNYLKNNDDKNTNSNESTEKKKLH